MFKAITIILSLFLKFHHLKESKHAVPVFGHDCSNLCSNMYNVIMGMSSVLTIKTEPVNHVTSAKYTCSLLISNL